MTTEPGPGPDTPNLPEAGPAALQPGQPAQPAQPAQPPAQLPSPPAQTAQTAQAAQPPGATSTSEVLQAMLARAVDNQRDDQRELTATIAEMRSQLMRMSQELAQLRVSPQPADDGAAAAQVNAVTVEMREAVRFLSDRLDGVTRMVAQRGEELADIRTALTAIDAHVRSQAETIGVLSAGLQALPSYGEQVSALHEVMQSVQRLVSGVAEGVQGVTGARLGERLGAVEEALGPLTHRVAAIGDTSAAQSAALAQLQATGAHVQQAVDALRAGFDPVASDITAIGGELTGLVEQYAEGASLDHRISETVTGATRASEERLAGRLDEHAAQQDERIEHRLRDLVHEQEERLADRLDELVTGQEERLAAHVDDAIIALAQTLLSRRTAATAGEITGTPVVPVAVAAGHGLDIATAGALDDDSADLDDDDLDDDDLDDDDSDEADDDLVDDDLGDGDLAGELEDEDLADELDDAGAGDDDEIDDEVEVEVEDGGDSGELGESEADEATDAAGEAGAHEPVDGPAPAAGAWWERDLPGAPAVAGDLADDDADDDAEDLAADDDDPMGHQADDAETDDETDDAETDDAETDDDGAASPSGWRPEVPPDRNPADPTVTVDDGKPKRRFFRRTS